MTPVLTDHARQRCAERGITPGTVKAAFRDAAATDYPAPFGHRRIHRVGELAIVYRPAKSRSS